MTDKDKENKTEHKCRVCGRAPLSVDEIGLTKKLMDKQAVDFYCLSCMAELLEATEAELTAKAEEFRAQGCTLFQRSDL
jgi:hypothetical protein